MSQEVMVEPIRIKGGKAWVTYRGRGDETVYGEMKSEGLDGSGLPSIKTEDGFQVASLNDRSINIWYTNSVTRDDYRCRFMPPLATYNSIHGLRKSVTCLALNGNGLGLSCDAASKLKLWTTDTGEIRRELEGHLMDVYTCQFFPSGLVALSGGADMCLKIWCVQTGNCAATLMGHAAGVTHTAMIDRGRNIVSVSHDGTARLWDCGTKSCLLTLGGIGRGAINGCSLGTPNQEMLSLGRVNNCNENEMGTNGKLLLLACEGASLHAVSLQSKKKVFEIRCRDAVNCCSFVTDTLAVYGTQGGHIAMIDIRNTQAPIKEVKERRSAIISLLPHKQGLFASSGDGSCFFMRETSDTTLELTGPDCDPVYKVVADDSHVFTACRDGAIRKYSAFC